MHVPHDSSGPCYEGGGIDEPAIHGATSPAAPRKSCSGSENDQTSCASDRLSRPSRRPQCKGANQSQHHVAQTHWREAVEKLVFKIDVQRSARRHAKHRMVMSRLGEPCLLTVRETLESTVGPHQARVAQLAEQGTLNPKVQGSIPCASTNILCLRVSGRASGVPDVPAGGWQNAPSNVLTAYLTAYGLRKRPPNDC